MRIWIGEEGALIGCFKCLSLSNAAGVCVLDDDTGRLVGEFLDAFERGVRVGDVVVAELLALELTCRGDRRVDAGASRDVECCLLMRVLAIAHALRLGELDRKRARNPSALLSGLSITAPNQFEIAAS